MRFIVFMLPNLDHDDYGRPTPEAAEAMSKYNESLEKAGVLLAADGLHPQTEGARLHFSGGDVRVVDGPFTEVKEVVGGFWMIQAKSREEAIEWAKRCPGLEGAEFTLEVRQVYDLDEFPDEVRQHLRTSEDLSTST